MKTLHVQNAVNYEQKLWIFLALDKKKLNWEKEAMVLKLCITFRSEDMDMV